jgi:hypothetical protein
MEQTVGTQCRCGKIAWPTEQHAKDTLVRLKIKSALKGNTKRRESRAYPCDIAPGWWHLTSMAEWGDRASRAEVLAAEYMERDAAVEDLLDLMEQHAAGVQRLVKRSESCAVENEGLLDVVKELAKAVQRHRESAYSVFHYSDQPWHKHDERLWRSLEGLSIPTPAGKAYISTLLDAEWVTPDEIENDPVKRAHAFGAKRLSALALGGMGLDVVTRSTVRALLPLGMKKPTGVNKITVKFGAALQSFEERGWIVRDTETVTVLDHEALSALAVAGTSQSPRGVLDTERALAVLINQPVSEQRDREILAVKALP